MNFDVKRPTRLPIIILFTWMALLLALGAWWLFLVVKQGNILLAHSQQIGQLSNYGKMAIYEGATFFFLLTGLFIYITLLYSRDIKRYNSLSGFFSSLGHELKTPLASIRLQAEVIKEMEEQNNHEMITKLVGRLTEDVEKLETEMEKILQLSRVERGAPLILTKTQISNFAESFKKDPVTRKNILIKWTGDDNLSHINIDEFALTIVLRNLIENTLKHANAEAPKVANISIKEDETDVIIIYSDNGAKTELDLNQLTNLFYRGQNKKGSGIGLYLSKQLLKAMDSAMGIQNENGLIFTMRFPKL